MISCSPFCLDFANAFRLTISVSTSNHSFPTCSSSLNQHLVESKQQWRHYQVKNHLKLVWSGSSHRKSTKLPRINVPFLVIHTSTLLIKANAVKLPSVFISLYPEPSMPTEPITARPREKSSIFHYISSRFSLNINTFIQQQWVKSYSKDFYITTNDFFAQINAVPLNTSILNMY